MVIVKRATMLHLRSFGHGSYDEAPMEPRYFERHVGVCITGSLLLKLPVLSEGRGPC